MTDGTVNAVAVDNGIAYIGGSFNSVGPDTGTFVTMDSTTALPNGPFAKVNGSVRACVSDGAGGWYIAGTFTNAGGLARNNIAHVLADGTVNPAWNPAANSFVVALAVSGSTVYAGGHFTSIGGESRNYIAALDATTGNATSWDPDAGEFVSVLAVSGSTIYAGGGFTTIGGQTRNYIAALDDTTGAATAWAPNASGTVNALAVSGSTVYAGGGFNAIGGESRSFIAALDATTGMVTSWDPSASGGIVYALALSGSTVYVGGGFTTIGGQSRNRIAALDAATGLATPWNPNAGAGVFALAVSGATIFAGGEFTSIGGQARNRLAALDATTGNAASWDPNAGASVFVIAPSASALAVGGEFRSIGGRTRSNIAALDAVTGIPTEWNPSADNVVRAFSVSGSTVYVGGQFTNIGGEARNRIAALDATTGLATSWDPDANDTVSALAAPGSTVFVGGAFTNIGGQARNFIAGLDTSTGDATAWAPNAGAAVEVLLHSSPVVYAGGSFNGIGGQPRDRIAALNASTGLATAWNPGSDNTVRALAVSGSVVYAAGNFSMIGGASRNFLAGLNDSTGNANSWNPNASLWAYALAVSGTTVYAGGSFLTAGGETRRRIAALNSSTGLATAWDPDAGNTVFALAVSGSSVYAAGQFQTIGGLSRRGYAQFDSTLVPASPSNAGAIAGPTSITWTWDDNSSDEDGFRVYSDSAYNGVPITLNHTTIANVEQWEETGLSPNLPYGMNVVAINAEGASDSSAAALAWTLAQVPVMPSLSSATLTTADVAIGGGDGNPSHTTYAIHHGNTNTWVQADGSLDASPVWQTAVEWDTLTMTGLASGTLHNVAVRARNGADVETANGPSASIGTDATLDYTAGANGSLSGDAAQVVAYNGSGTAVTAIPDAGYSFIDWSDASTDNPRTDTNVTANVAVTANFADQTAPTSVASGSSVQIGGDLTGTYVADDTGSGVASVALYAKEPGGSWTNVGAVTGGTWAFTPTQGGDAGDGLYRFATVATDVAANSGTAPAGNDPGDVATLYNDVANSNFAHTFAADGTAQFPMTATEVMEIALTGVTAPVTITVSRTVGDVAPSGMMAERLIDESLSITGALAGASATITWNYDPTNTDAPGFVTTLDTVFQFNGATPTGEYAVTPVGNSITFGPVSSLSDWFAGSNDASVADWMMLTE